MKKWMINIVIVAFGINTLVVFPVKAEPLVLPVPGMMVHLSPPVNPPILKGMKVNPNNPFRFEFILDKGDSVETRHASSLQDDSTRLIKYFLASLTIPEKDLWVNLSPYEKNRIVPDSFGLTEMGRDLLAQDYILKQVTASLIYPEDEVGKKFWKRVYEEAAKKYGNTNIPVNTFNKVWIVPEKAVVYENAKAGTAYVVESKLKVMLEADYLSLEKNTVGVGSPDPMRKGGVTPPVRESNQIGSQIVREIVIPELTKEINEGANFAQLRQVYSSLILATWYKKKIKDSILSKVFVDKSKIVGVGLPDPMAKGGETPPVRNEINVEKIYQQYLTAFKKGVYNYIKEETDPVGGQTVPRKYFSGGATFTDLAMSSAMTQASSPGTSFPDAAMKVMVDLKPFVAAKDQAMAASPAKVIGFFPGVGNYKAYNNVGPAIYRQGTPQVRKIFEEAAGVLGLAHPEDLFITNISPDRMWADSFIFASVVTYTLALHAKFLQEAQERQVFSGFQAYAADSLGTFAAAVASGAISFKDALLLAHEMPQAMWRAVEQNGNKLHHVVDLKSPDIKRHLAVLESMFGDDFLVFRYAAADEISAYTARELTRRVQEASEAQGVTFSQSSTDTSLAIIHSKPLLSARQELVRFMDDHGIVFHDPSVPIISSNPKGVLNRAQDVKEAILGILDEPMDSHRMLNLIDQAGADAFIEIGRGQRSRAIMISKNDVKTPFHEFTGDAAHDGTVMEAIRYRRPGITSPGFWEYKNASGDSYYFGWAGVKVEGDAKSGWKTRVMSDNEVIDLKAKDVFDISLRPGIFPEFEGEAQVHMDFNVAPVSLRNEDDRENKELNYYKGNVVVTFDREGRLISWDDIEISPSRERDMPWLRDFLAVKFDEIKGHVFHDRAMTVERSLKETIGAKKVFEFKSLIFPKATSYADIQDPGRRTAFISAMPNNAEEREILIGLSPFLEPSSLNQLTAIFYHAFPSDLDAMFAEIDAAKDEQRVKLIAEAALTVSAYFQPEGKKIVVVISDNGIGIPLKVLQGWTRDEYTSSKPRIIEPFEHGYAGGKGLGVSLILEAIGPNDSMTYETRQEGQPGYRLEMTNYPKMLKVVDKAEPGTDLIITMPAKKGVEDAMDDRAMATDSKFKQIPDGGMDQEKYEQKVVKDVKEGMSYEKTKRWMKAKKETNIRLPWGFWDHPTTARNAILVALDSIRGFKKAREDGDVAKMADLYRKNVIKYVPQDSREYPEGGQLSFFYEVGYLSGLMARKRPFLNNKLNSAAALLRFALPAIIDVRKREALDPLEVEKNYWSDPDNARYHILLALDTIPGFKKARTAGDVKTMADLYRQHVIGYQVKDQSGYFRNGQQGFFQERGGLNGLISGGEREFLQKKGSPQAMLRFALPALVNQSNADALRAEEISRNTDEAMTTDDLVSENGRLNLAAFENVFNAAVKLANERTGLNMEVLISGGVRYLASAARKDMDLIFVSQDGQKVSKNTYYVAFRQALEDELAKVQGYQAHELQMTYESLNMLSIKRKSEPQSAALIKVEPFFAPFHGELTANLPTPEAYLFERVMLTLDNYSDFTDRGDPGFLYDALKDYVAAEYFIGDLELWKKARDRFLALNQRDRDEIKRFFNESKARAVSLLADIQQKESTQVFLDKIAQRLRMPLKDLVDNAMAADQEQKNASETLTLLMRQFLWVRGAWEASSAQSLTGRNFIEISKAASLSTSKDILYADDCLSCSPIIIDDKDGPPRVAHFQFVGGVDITELFNRQIPNLNEGAIVVLPHDRRYQKDYQLLADYLRREKKVAVKTMLVNEDSVKAGFIALEGFGVIARKGPYKTNRSFLTKIMTWEQLWESTSDEITMDSISNPDIQKDAVDEAQTSTGGIDFNTDKMKLETRSNGGDIQFKMNPELLAQLQNAKGFVPVIIDMKPLADIPGFLGYMKEEAKPTLGLK